MSFSAPQVESRIEFSPLPQNVELGCNEIQIKDGHIVIEPWKERFDWEALVILLRLAFFGMLLFGIALHQRQLSPPKFDTVPPKFILESFHIPRFKVSQGEVSSTWDATLTISNAMNSSNIIILRLDAEISYKENETLAVITPITAQKQVFLLEREETKKVPLKLNTTGWEENQPIVDDNTVQAIAEDVQRGATSFSLRMKVMGEVEFGDGWIATFSMYPICNDIQVKFLVADKQGEAATIIDHKPRECVGRIEWQPL